MSRRSPKPRESEEIYAYTEEDLANILSDCFVDIRDVTGDSEAADIVDMVYGRLTDDFYGHE